MNKALSQYFTPTWAAEIIVEQLYPHLSANDLVIEPTCGDGRFLSAIPAHVPAYGVELDPIQADAAHVHRKCPGYHLTPHHVGTGPQNVTQLDQLLIEYWLVI